MEIQALTLVARPSSVAATPRQEEKAAPAREAKQLADGFFVTPFLQYDSSALTVIFQVRDSETGDVKRQFPSEEVVERYRQDPTLGRPFAEEAEAGRETGIGGEQVSINGDGSSSDTAPLIGGPSGDRSGLTAQAGETAGAPATNVAPTPAPQSVPRTPVDLIA